MSDRGHKFVFLDGLRGIAAFAIVTRHAPPLFNSITEYGSIPDRSGNLPEVGPLFESYLAVDFFFMLSGFVLAHAYGQKLRAQMSLTRFMGIRLIRLYPLYILALAIFLAPQVRAIAHGDTSVFSTQLIIEVVLAIMFLPSTSPVTKLMFPLNPVSWSLFFELVANMAFGVVGRYLTTGLLAIVVGILGLTLTCAVSMHWFAFGSLGIGAMTEGYYWNSIGAGLLRGFFGFFSGALLYILWERKPIRLRVPPVVIIVVFAAILSAHPPSMFERVYDLAATLIAFPAIIYISASVIVTPYLGRVFSTLGLASYGIYVLHVPLYQLVWIVLYKYFAPLPNQLPIVSGICFTVLVFAVALVLYYSYDLPIRRILMGRLIRGTSSGLTRTARPTADRQMAA